MYLLNVPFFYSAKDTAGSPEVTVLTNHDTAMVDPTSILFTSPQFHSEEIKRSTTRH